MNSKIVNRSDTIAIITRASPAHMSFLTPNVRLQDIHATFENFSRLMTTEMSHSRYCSVLTPSENPCGTLREIPQGKWCELETDTASNTVSGDGTVLQHNQRS